jgi:hypothetical protein
VLLVVLASVGASASAITLSDTLSISGSNGGAENCTGGPLKSQTHDVNGKETPTYANVHCKGNYNIGVVNGIPSDNLRYDFQATLRSYETKVEKPQSDVITIKIVAVSLPDSGPGTSDSLTVTITDALHLYNFTKTVLITELANGHDSPNVAILAVPGTVHPWPLEGGKLGDSISINGGAQLQSYTPAHPDLVGETTTEIITIVAGSDAPEPSSMMLFGSGLIGLGGLVRRRMTK